jgi:hypothetical protein
MNQAINQNFPPAKTKFRDVKNPPRDYAKRRETTPTYWNHGERATASHPFTAGDRGSNPLGDAKRFQRVATSVAALFGLDFYVCAPASASPPATPATNINNFK